MRRIVLAAVTALVLSACGDGGTLTQAQVDAMSDDEALALLDCQGDQVVEEMGMEAGTDYMAELMMGPSEDPDGAVSALFRRYRTLRSLGVGRIASVRAAAVERTAHTSIIHPRAYLYEVPTSCVALYVFQLR